jgi:hypothetical protein
VQLFSSFRETAPLHLSSEPSGYLREEAPLLFSKLLFLNQIDYLKSNRTPLPRVLVLRMLIEFIPTASEPVKPYE